MDKQMFYYLKEPTLLDRVLGNWLEIAEVALTIAPVLMIGVLAVTLLQRKGRPVSEPPPSDQ